MTEDRQSVPGALFNRLLGAVVPPVVDSVDLDHVVEQIDVNDVVNRVDLDHVIAGLDINEVLDRIDPDRLLDRMDLNRLLDRLDLNRLLDRLDVDRFLDRLDVDRFLDRLDVDRFLDRLDVDRFIGRLDVDAVVQRVDLNAAIEQVDIDRIVARVDIDAVVQRVDLNAAIDHVDIDRVIARVDLDAAVDRVDLNRAMDRIDLNAVIERTELGSIIARSTTGVFGELLDAARTQVMVVDQIAQGIPARLMRGINRETPAAPAGVATEEEIPDRTLTASERAVAFQGRYAGSVSRFLAFVVDQFAIGALFGLGSLLVSAALTVVTGADLTLDEDRLILVISYALWAFVYYAGSTAATGRTIGKAIAGLLVVHRAGDRVSGKAAALRTVAFPISFLLFGVGLLLGLFRQDRRELHDLIAGTAVIYAWDAAIAERRTRQT